MPKKRAVIVGRMGPPPADRVAEWNNWYNTKHMPDRLAIPGFLLSRRFENVDVDPGEYTSACKTFIGTVLGKEYNSSFLIDDSDLFNIHVAQFEILSSTYFTIPGQKNLILILCTV